MAVAVLAAVAGLASWPYMWEGEFMSRWSAAATIMSVIGAPFLYFQKMRDRERDLEAAADDEERRASRSLCLELEDTLKTFQNKRYVWNIRIGSERVHFVNRLLSHDIYDGLVGSAKMGFLRPDLQQRTQKVFRKIKMHDRYLIEMSERTDVSGSYMLQCCTLLVEYETDLKDEIPRLMNELQKK